MCSNYLYFRYGEVLVKKNLMKSVIILTFFLSEIAGAYPPTITDSTPPAVTNSYTQKNYLDDYREALEIINKFAVSTCNSIPIEGSGDSLKLTGSGKVEVGRLIKKLGDLNLNVKGEYKSNNGILQKELASLLIKSEKCRVDLANNLIERILPNISTFSPSQKEEKKKKN